MDKLINMGKDMLEERMSGQGQSQGQSNNGSSSGGVPNDVVKMASQHAAGNSSGSSDLFSNILGAVGQKQDKIQNEDIDEEEAVKKHKQAYQHDGHGDTNTLGTAAAMQALKKFTQSDNSASSNAGQAAFLGMAMSEASKLFDDKAAQGKVAGGANKENVIQQAAETAFKMYLKSQGSSQGGLAGLAAKFLA